MHGVNNVKVACGYHGGLPYDGHVVSNTATATATDDDDGDDNRVFPSVLLL